MNISEIKDIIAQKFATIDEPTKAIVRAYSLYGKEPFALWLFDCSESILAETFDIKRYQEQWLRDEFFRISGSLQWNLYCYFLCDDTGFEKLTAKGVRQTVEMDRNYARKFVATPQMLRKDFAAVAAVSSELASGTPTDVGALWERILLENGLPIVLSSLPYAEISRRIEAGIGDDTDVNNEPQNDSVDANVVQGISHLSLKNYRQLPHQKDFSFAECNLFYGVNGSGKTSLLEAIELWMCGKHRRNPDISPQMESIALTVKGKAEECLGPVRNAALYRNRDHLWYGNYQARKNEMCFNFGRFNFYNADAGTMLEISQDELEIRESLSKLLLGDSATRLSERVAKLLPDLQPRERSVSDEIRNAEESISSAKDTISALEKPTKSRKRSYGHLLKQLDTLGWKGSPPSDSQEEILELSDAVNHSLETLTSVIEAIPWLPALSVAALKKEVANLDKCSRELLSYMQSINSLGKEQSQLVVQLKDNNRQQELIARRIAYSEAGADALRNTGCHIAKLQDKKRAATLAREQMVGIDIPSYSQIEETVTVVEKRVHAELKEAEKAESAQKDMVVSLEKLHGEIASLVTEIHEKAISLLKITPQVETCPVCGANYPQGGLLQRLHSQLHYGNIPDLQTARTILSDRVKRVKDLAKYLHDIDLIKSTSVGILGIENAVSLPVKALAGSLATLDKVIIQCADDIKKADRAQKQFEVKGYSEEEFVELEEKIAHEFPSIDLSSKSALKVLHAQLQQKHVGYKNRQSTVEKESTAHRNNVADLLAKQFHGECKSAEDVQSRLNRVSEGIERLKTLKPKLPLVDEQALADSAVQIKTLKDAVEGYLRIIEKEESVATVIAKSRTIISHAQELLKQKKPIQERLQKAIAVLEKLLKEHAGEHYLSDLFSQNLASISEMFRIIHAPQEFEKIELDEQDFILAVRKNGPPSPVSMLSSGQRNALSLSIFLTMNRKASKGPPLIMLDDPVAHVDDLNIISFFDCLRHMIINSKRQLFFATASAKTASLFRKKFDFLGSDGFRSFELFP